MALRVDIGPSAVNRSDDYMGSVPGSAEPSGRLVLMDPPYMNGAAAGALGASTTLETVLMAAFLGVLLVVVVVGFLAEVLAELLARVIFELAEPFLAVEASLVVERFLAAEATAVAFFLGVLADAALEVGVGVEMDEAGGMGSRRDGNWAYVVPVAGAGATEAAGLAGVAGGFSGGGADLHPATTMRQTASRQSAVRIGNSPSKDTASTVDLG